MNNRQFDLNLIRVFCTVYDTGSLTLTAEILEITQPAISHALKKLRLFYDDPLFVRSEGKMLPTQRAKNIIPNFKKSIELINISLQATTLFSPAESKKKFHFSMSDMSQIYFLPPLCLILEEIIDKVSIDIMQVTQEKIERIMRVGDLDFALGNLPDLIKPDGKIISETLFTDKFICMIRDGHPLTTKNNKTINFKKLNIMELKNKKTGHHKLIESISKDFFNHVALSISSYTVAPEIVKNTDLGVIIPKSVAKRYNSENQFRFYEIDMPNNNIDVNLYYHQLYENDPSIIWMKNIIIQNFREN
ncbi:LysR family transcriptional regulator [Amphritea opalescens]|uniref:LysR family transcriptional regulator n=1 Tax=Amphritea opalescens TaxID=2490544 RepID=A0A430KM17_9GAMM|nr:LysR family transcriptional regulator [Amphritea opalescens]RTE64506.1 LysR family transcriptional regulator [Amphritea opalescens]